MGINVRNFYFLIAGILAILFAFTHAWNGQSAVLPMLHVSAIAMDTRTVVQRKGKRIYYLDDKTVGVNYRQSSFLS
ncbi:hypothetical protein MKY48_18345 [Paenibacillus sp. FSL W8-0187]|uniref:hypothetical protein n=1 Tax=Paenibacillus sp. FSL W8-0187 TaxID=2921710 RepID=UPI0030DBF6EF